MTATAEQNELNQLRAFEERMRTQGAAAFANGPEPWNTWQETIQEAGNRVWESAQRRDSEVTEKTMCEKLMTTMATVAVAALAVGIGGVYMTAQHTPRLADNAGQPAMLAETPPAADTPTSGTVLRQPQIAAPAPLLPATETASPAATAIAMAPAADETVEPSAADLNEPEPPPTTIAATDSSSDPVTRLTDALPAPAAGTPQQLTMRTPPETAPAATPPASEAKAAAEASKGKWVVNISSYAFESYARRKLDEFRNRGVIAEIHPVTIKGKRMYRIRATGYETRQEAQTWQSLLQDRLGVEGAWVSKR